MLLLWADDFNRSQTTAGASQCLLLLISNFQIGFKCIKHLLKLPSAIQKNPLMSVCLCVCVCVCVCVCGITHPEARVGFIPDSLPLMQWVGWNHECHITSSSHWCFYSCSVCFTVCADTPTSPVRNLLKTFEFSVLLEETIGAWSRQFLNRASVGCSLTFEMTLSHAPTHCHAALLLPQ